MSQSERDPRTPPSPRTERDTTPRVQPPRFQPTRLEIPDLNALSNMSASDIESQTRRLREQLGVRGGIGRVGEACEVGSIECKRRDLAALAIVANFRNRMWLGGARTSKVEPLPKLADSFRRVSGA